MNFENYEYVVKINGKELHTECNYSGYMECLKFIHDNAPDYDSEKTFYKIRCVRKEVR